MQVSLDGVRKGLRTIAACALFAILIGGTAFASQDPQQPDSYNSSTPVPPEKPPAKPANAAADGALTQKIRKAIADDTSLSANGRRVKVTTQAGKVTLQGSAGSEAERTNIFTKAADVAGSGNVSNSIKVPSSPQS
jgi:osmotically-inducible protein OsmY